MGTGSSGVALQVAPLAAENKVLFVSGPAASDAITGANRYTFRSGRQSYQDVLDRQGLPGRRQEGRGLRAGTRRSASRTSTRSPRWSAPGAKVTSIAVPASATDFTPFATQIKTAESGPRLRRVGGTTAGAMWQALDQQGAFTGTEVVTGLAGRATWAASATRRRDPLPVALLRRGAEEQADAYLVAQPRKRGQVPDLFPPDGFVLAQMLVHALRSADDNVAKMVGSLEGWNFLGQGLPSVSPQDHALLQPMFRVKLDTKGGGAY